MKLYKLLFLIPVVFLLSACSHTGATIGTNGNSNNDTDIEVDAVIEMEDFEFSPRVIEAVPGETLTIQVKSATGLHDFTVDDLNIASNIVSQGNFDIVEIKIPLGTSGEEYEFYCSVMDHRSQGMTGKIIVK